MKFSLGTGDPKLTRYLKINSSRPQRVMRMFMVEFYRQVTISTPVDTGRARYGWNCSIGTPDLTIPPEGQYNLDASRATGVFTVKNVTGKDTLYISNAVPYIENLNDGSSSQAPARFVELSFDTSVRKLDKYSGDKES